MTVAPSAATAVTNAADRDLLDLELLFTWWCPPLQAQCLDGRYLTGTWLKKTALD
jgi:hypothetical protein